MGLNWIYLDLADASRGLRFGGGAQGDSVGSTYQSRRAGVWERL